MDTVISGTYEDFADSCPLRTDVNSCTAIKYSKVNDCPVYDCVNDKTIISLKCPLKHGQVIIKLDRD